MKYSYALSLLMAIAAPVFAQDTTTTTPAATTPAVTTPSTTATGAPTPYPDACAKACMDKRSECQSKPDANRATCAAEFAACVGYNPYAEQPYVDPTACSHSSMPAPTGAAGCAMACTGRKNECMGKPDANHSTCAAEYADCLGYNPYAAEPYVEPTACSHAAAPTGTEKPAPTKGTEPPAVTAGGDRVKPVVALLALGAAALL